MGTTQASLRTLMVRASAAVPRDALCARAHASRTLRLLVCPLALFVGGCGSEDGEAFDRNGGDDAATSQQAPGGPLVTAQPSQPPGSSPVISTHDNVTIRIATGEYRIRPGDHGLTAPNRAMGLRATWARDGVWVTGRDISADVAPGRGGGARLTTTRLVRGGDELRLTGAAFAEGACRTDGELDEEGKCLRRAETSLAPGIREWWENRRDGLEQGFTLEQRPLDTGGSSEPLELHVRINAKRVTLDEAAQAVAIELPSGRELRYSHLVAQDARGRALDARFRAAEGGVAIEVDDREALYPVEIDPILEGTPSWTADPSDNASSLLGFAVAGADFNGDGYSDVVIGAWRYDNGQTDEGKVWVYLGGPTGLQNTSAWSQESNQAFHYYGYSVVGLNFNGDGRMDLAVGAPNAGRVYLYRSSTSGTWSFTAVPFAPSGVGARFGESVGTAKVNADAYADLIVGNSLYSSNKGRAYLFLSTGSAMSTTPTWTATGAQNNDKLGHSVVGAGDTDGDGREDVVVAENNGGGAGRARLYKNTGSTLTSFSTWSWITTQEGGQAGDGVYQVASAGDVNNDGKSDVIVSSELFGADEGKAFLFQGRNDSQGLTASSTWSKAAGQAGARLRHVAAAGDVNADGFDDVLWGALLYNTNGGKAALHLGESSAAGLGATSAWSFTGSNNEMLGPVASAGDVNGDGKTDVIVGSSMWSGNVANEGRAYVFLSSTMEDTVGVFYPVSGELALRTSNGANSTNVEITQFIAESQPEKADRHVVVGDWDGDGIDTLGFYYADSATFELQNSSTNLAAPRTQVVLTSMLGLPNLVPIAGDWNGDGLDTVGLYQPDFGITARFHLFYTHADDIADRVVTFGGANWIPVTGDWDDNDTDTLGVYDPATRTFYFKNTNDPPPGGGGNYHDIAIVYGDFGWVPLVGDWDGDGVDTVGVYDPASSTFNLRNSNVHNPAGNFHDLSFQTEYRDGVPLVGNWGRLPVNNPNLYVALNGNDANPGTKQQPLRSLEAAQQAVATLVAQQATKSVTVYLRDGFYPLSQTVAFDEGDSGKPGFDVLYRSYPGETATLQGFVPIVGTWVNEGGGLYSISLDTGGYLPRQLYFDGKKAIRARHPDLKTESVAFDAIRRKSTSYTQVQEWLEAQQQVRLKATVGREETVPPVSPVNLWSSLTANGKRCSSTVQNPVEIVISTEWLEHRMRIENWTEANGLLTLTPCNLDTEFFDLIGGPRVPNQYAYLENSREFLDDNNEWYYDLATRKLYYRPPSGPFPTTFSYARLETTMKVRGASPTAPIHDVVFKNLSFNGSGFDAPNQRGFVNLTGGLRAHKPPLPGGSPDLSECIINEVMVCDWKFPSAAVEVFAARNVGFYKNAFLNLGGTALILEGATVETKVVGNWMNEVGGSCIAVGVQVAASNDAGRYSTGDLIEDNAIHNCGSDFAGSAAIYIDYATNLSVRSNWLKNLPYSGIHYGNDDICYNLPPPNPAYYTVQLKGGDIVEQNFIEDYMTQLRDGGGIYARLKRPVQIRNNVLRNLVPVQPAYLGAPAVGVFVDDATQFAEITGNRLVNVVQNPFAYKIKINNIACEDPNYEVLCGTTTYDDPPVQAPSLCTNFNTFSDNCWADEPYNSGSWVCHSGAPQTWP